MKLNRIFSIPQLCVNKNLKKTVIDPSANSCAEISIDEIHPEVPMLPPNIQPFTPLKSAITPLQNQIRKADDSSSKFVSSRNLQFREDTPTFRAYARNGAPVTDFHDAPLRGADTNLHRYKKIHSEERVGISEGIKSRSRSRSHSGSDIIFQFKTILNDAEDERRESVASGYMAEERSSVDILPSNREISSLSLDTMPVVDLVGKEEKPAPLEEIFEPRTNQSNLHRHEEHQYLDLIRDIIDRGYLEKGRNGNVLVKFGHSMRFSLRDGVIPILTTKRVAWKTCFEELFWFIRGSTSNRELIDKNVHIWDANGSREFLDSRGLYFLEENDLGPIYGFQWRHFNADYTNCDKNYHGEGIDQLSEIIESLKNPETRSSRRLIMTAWNPCQLNTMALPPCHVLAQFNVREGRYLSCALYQRSGDVGLGVPFNIASYSMLTHILAKHCGLEADEFVYFLGNCHIYEQHVPALKTQIEREPKQFPRIRIATKHTNIEDYSLEDIIWETKYESLGTIKMDMVA